MDWNSLLSDLESRFEAEHRAELAAQSADLAEAEVASIVLLDRLRAAVGRPLHLRTRSGLSVEGLLVRVEDSFILLSEGEGLQTIVPVGALCTVSGLPGPAPSPRGRRPPTFSAVLRELARRGVRVRLTLSGGDLTGRIVRVAADHVDVVVDGAGRGRAGSLTAGAGTGAAGAVSVALAAVEAVRSR